MADFAVILPAAGLSSRFGRDKLNADLAGHTVMARTLAAFLPRPDVRLILIATRLEQTSGEQVLADLERALAGLGQAGEAVRARVRVCAGGASRAHSVLHALREVPAAIEWVAVHDAARPLVSQGLIDRTLAAAVMHGSAAPAMPVALTIKRARGTLPAQVVETIPRGELWAMQTPQIMRRSDLLAAFERCPIPLEQVTDDVQLLELAGKPVWLVEGEERNLKITTPLDLRMAEWLLEK